MSQEINYSRFCPRCRRHYEAERTVCPGDGTRLLSIPILLPRPGNIFDQRYVLLETIGKGGMATIFRAWDARRKRQCAVKVLNAKFSSEERAVAQFFGEARTARNLYHPNIIEVFDYGRTEVGYLFIAMELLEGQTLSRIIRSQGPLSPQRSVNLFAQVLDALQAAHKKGTVHRDLKPENIFVTCTKGREGVKLLDFGIAQVTGTLNHGAREICGTPAYMSPEQIRGRGAAPETDLYSAGIVLFEMLTGTQPFAGGTHMEVLKKQLRTEPPSLRAALPELATFSSLDVLCHRLMRKAPSQRFPSAAQAREALSEACRKHALDLADPVATIRYMELDPAPEEMPKELLEHQALELTSDFQEELSLEFVPKSVTSVSEEKLSSALTKAESATDPFVVSGEYSLLHLRFCGPREEPGHDADRVREELSATLETWFEFVSESGGLVCMDAGTEMKVLFGYLSDEAGFVDRCVDMAHVLAEESVTVCRNAGIAGGVRCGISTGRVFVDPDQDGPLDWMVKGSRLDLAVRLSRLAPIGSAVLCEETAMRTTRTDPLQSLPAVQTRDRNAIRTYLLRCADMDVTVRTPSTEHAPTPPALQPKGSLGMVD